MRRVSSFTKLSAESEYRLTALFFRGLHIIRMQNFTSTESRQAFLNYHYWLLTPSNRSARVPGDNRPNLDSLGANLSRADVTGDMAVVRQVFK